MRNRFLVAVLCFCAGVLRAQPDRLAGPVDASRMVALAGSRDSRAAAANDRGRVDAAFQMQGLVLRFQKSEAQQRDLDQLLASQQDSASPNYHRWLTPEQYADRFGVSPADAGRIQAWLEGEGFQVSQIARGRAFLVFNGTSEQVERSFQTEIHKYQVNGAAHFANAADPSIPESLAGLVGAISGLDDFYPQPDGVVAAYTAGNGHDLAPDDITTIYDIAPLFNQGIDGTGQTIAIAGESSLVLSDIQMFQTLYNLPLATPQVILVPGLANPGQNSALAEADLDIETVAAVARHAHIIYVYSANPFDAVNYAIDQNLAPVVNASYHSGCDTTTSAAMAASYRAMAQQGNAEGITWVNSSGDIGPAGCDNNGTAVASGGLSTRFPSDIPEVTAVGGTQFNDLGGTYWNGNNSPNSASAIGYIPEVVWNDNPPGQQIDASTGGASSLFTKPVWQVGTGVPSDGQRDIPDVSFSASAHTPYRIVTGGAVQLYYGSSASAPLFTGIVSLLNQWAVSKEIQAQPGLGNLNQKIYEMASVQPTVFHDVTIGNTIVACLSGSSNCKTGTYGYTAGPGYDLCTGWGSIDVMALLLNWGMVTGSDVNVSSSANPVYEGAPDANGNSWTVMVTLTEVAGAATTLTGFLVDGSDQLAASFPKTAIAAFGSMSATLSFADQAIPLNHEFVFMGMDAGGKTWTRLMGVTFDGFQPVTTGAAPILGGESNNASGQQAYAPGMILSIYGADMASGTQPAPSVPLPDQMQNSQATMNGVIMPLYYASGDQMNAQIPYGTPPGPATLVVYDGGRSTSLTLNIVPAAPGIFVDANGNTTPFPSGSAGQILTLFITGEGEVSPALPTGTGPSTSIPVTQLPQPVLPVSMTIGNVPAKIDFYGIPYGLVGVTQINFTVPPGLSGVQPVVVTVGTTASLPAKFTVTP